MSNSSEQRKAYRREWMRQHRATNREHLNERARQLRAAHPEMERAKRRSHYERTHPGAKRRLILTPDERVVRERERAAAARERNKDRLREQQKAYYARHKARVLARNKAWAKANPERIRQLSLEGTNRRTVIQRGAEGSHTRQEWEALKQRCGHRCACCREAKKLTKDHIVPLVAGGSDYIENIQPLCRECNSSKRDRHAINYMAQPGASAS